MTFDRETEKKETELLYEANYQPLRLFSVIME